MKFIVISAICEENGIRPSWLLWVCIALAVLFLIMLLMNIFLCTAMSCSCARTEVSLGKYSPFPLINRIKCLSDHREGAFNHRGV